jgi:hypothetical protein
VLGLQAVSLQPALGLLLLLFFYVVVVVVDLLINWQRGRQGERERKGDRGKERERETETETERETTDQKKRFVTHFCDKILR